MFVHSYVYISIKNPITPLAVTNPLSGIFYSTDLQRVVLKGMHTCKIVHHIFWSPYDWNQSPIVSGIVHEEQNRISQQMILFFALYSYLK